MFSAVALVAFSFAGMANTIEEEKECSKESIEQNNIDPDCVKVANSMVLLHSESSTSLGAYIVTWVTIYNNCVKTKVH